jgi:hypothetical protein
LSRRSMEVEDGEPVDQREYRSMIGSLLYLTATRPDIQFSVCLCACFQASPRKTDRPWWTRGPSASSVFRISMHLCRGSFGEFPLFAWVVFWWLLFALSRVFRVSFVCSLSLVHVFRGSLWAWCAFFSISWV